MTHKDAEFFVKVQGGIIVTTFTAVVAPAAIVPVAKVVKEKRKEVSKQIFCILALTSPCNSERIDGRKYDPDLTTIQQQQSLIRMEEQIQNAERLR